MWEIIIPQSPSVCVGSQTQQRLGKTWTCPRGGNDLATHLAESHSVSRSLLKVSSQEGWLNMGNRDKMICCSKPTLYTHLALHGQLVVQQSHSTLTTASSPEGSIHPRLIHWELMCPDILHTKASVCLRGIHGQSPSLEVCILFKTDGFVFHSASAESVHSHSIDNHPEDTRWTRLSADRHSHLALSEINLETKLNQ